MRMLSTLHCIVLLAAFLHAVLAPDPNRPKINRQMGFEDSITTARSASESWSSSTALQIGATLAPVNTSTGSMSSTIPSNDRRC